MQTDSVSPGLYFDASVLAALVLREPRREKDILKKIRSLPNAQPVSSEIVLLELQSAVSVSIGDRLERLSELDQEVLRICAPLQFYAASGTTLQIAQSLIRRHRFSSGLRPLDAVHIATACLIHQAVGNQAQAGPLSTFQFLTCDKKQHGVALLEGLDSFLVA